MNVEEAVREFFRAERIPPDARIVAGFSGGADSTALLCALQALGVPVTAVHVHHGLRGAEADRDAEFCRALCERRGIPFLRRDVRVTEHLDGRGVEAAARTLRYAALEEAARICGAEYIAVAHNASDALETALFNLARGTGAGGLGIAPRRTLSCGLVLMRPVLSCTHGELTAYLEALGEAHVEDSTNSEDSAARNILRHYAVPALRRVNAQAEHHALEALRRLREDDEALTDYARALAVVPASARALRTAPRAVAVRAVRLLYGRLDLTARHIEAVLALCESSDGHGSVDLPGLRAVREYDELRMCAPADAPADRPAPAELVPDVSVRFGEWRITVKKTEKVTLNFERFHNIYVDSGAIHGILLVRPRQPGDRFRAQGAPGSKSLKRAMIDAKIPAGLRDTLPVFVHDGGICAVCGLGASADCAPGANRTEAPLLQICMERE